MKKVCNTNQCIKEVSEKLSKDLKKVYNEVGKEDLWSAMKHGVLWGCYGECRS